MEEHEHHMPMYVSTPDGPKWVLAGFKHHHAMPAEIDEHWHGVYIGGGTNAMTLNALAEIYAQERGEQGPMPGVKATSGRAKKL